MEFVACCFVYYVLVEKQEELLSDGIKLLFADGMPHFCFLVFVAQM